jgi:ribosome-associated toxin RatA of RatAB toxin-antitoxin module
LGIEQSLITNLVEKKVRKVTEVELDVKGAGNFVCAKVKVDVRQVLARFVSMSRGGQREIYQIKCEKMPKILRSLRSYWTFTPRVLHR